MGESVYRFWLNSDLGIFHCYAHLVMRYQDSKLERKIDCNCRMAREFKRIPPPFVTFLFNIKKFLL